MALLNSYSDSPDLIVGCEACYPDGILMLPSFSIEQVCLPLFVVRASSAKFGLHVSNMKFIIQNKE
jgi:hypothetical protein